MRTPPPHRGGSGVCRSAKSSEASQTSRDTIHPDDTTMTGFSRSSSNQPHVISVNLSATHSFSKTVVSQIRLLEGLGVEGDAHAGVTVQHRSRIAKNPNQPNLRQVHLMHAELFDELAPRGFTLAAGDIGENITTRGIDLLSLPVDTDLIIGATARVRITGLRNPCHQLNDFQEGLTRAVLEKRPDGSVIRKSGIMGVVLVGGVVAAGDTITVILPPTPHRALDWV